MSKGHPDLECETKFRIPEITFACSGREIPACARIGACHQRGLPNVNLSILHNHRGCYHRFTKDRTVIVWVFVAYKISLLPYKWQAVKCDMINVKVLESDHSFSIVEMFSFSITVSLVPLVFTARLNLRANCDGAFKYVIKGKHGWGFWQEPGHKPF